MKGIKKEKKKYAGRFYLIHQQGYSYYTISSIHENNIWSLHNRKTLSFTVIEKHHMKSEG